MNKFALNYQIQLLSFGLMIGFCLSGCNSAEDVHHPTPEQMTRTVQAAIDEPVSFVRVETNEQDKPCTYIFNLDDRGVTFEARSIITAFSMDGTVFGNYYQETRIMYEEGIAESELYSAERARIAAGLDIEEEDLGYGLAVIHLKNYTDIEKLAEYAVAVDQLYAFKEKKPDQIHHIDLGALDFSDPGNSIAGAAFTTSDGMRLKYDRVVEDVTAAYIAQLKQFDQTDATIPTELWDMTE